MLYAVSVVLRDFCAVNGQICAAVARAARRAASVARAAAQAPRPANRADRATRAAHPADQIHQAAPAPRGVWGVSPAAVGQGNRREGLRRGKPCDSVYYVYAADRTGEICLTNTAAFRAVDRLHGHQRENAAIYDENGWCLYR